MKLAAYSAKMVHNKDTIMKLSLMQYNTFTFKNKLIRIGISVALIAYGTFGEKSSFLPMASLIVGCLMIANINIRPMTRARRVTEQINGNFPHSEYSFTSAGFADGKDRDTVPYSKLIRLVDDGKYLYLYISSESAYMVDKATVSGGSADALKEYISRKASKPWTKPISLLNFSLRSLRGSSDGYEGPRLR